MKNRTEKSGSFVNDWATPDYILDMVRKEFGEFHDPCPLNELEQGLDGLSSEWGDVNYINPPYTRKDKEAFIVKALEESKKGKICVMLIPASTETKIFHDVIAPNAEVRLIRRRIKFKGTNSFGEYVTSKSGQCGSMFVIFGPEITPKIIVVDIGVV